MSSDAEPFELVVPFDRDAPDFARGVEMGMLYERLRQGERPTGVMVHATNIEMAIRLAETFGVSASADELSQDWLSFSFS
jgi:hypothetical protein